MQRRHGECDSLFFLPLGFFCVCVFCLLCTDADTAGSDALPVPGGSSGGSR